MHYAAYIYREGDQILAEFPDCPGCQTFADSADELADAAREALEGWLEAHLTSGQVPPRPVERTGAPEGMKLARVGVRAGLAAALSIRWARHERGLSQKQLGERAGVSQQQIAKLENPDENPSIATLEKVGRALGLEVGLDLSPSERVAPPPLVLSARQTAEATYRTLLEDILSRPRLTAGDIAARRRISLEALFKATTALRKLDLIAQFDGPKGVKAHTTWSPALEGGRHALLEAAEGAGLDLDRRIRAKA